VTYRVLPESLRPTADLVQKYMKGKGLSKIHIEEPIDEALDFSPTLSCRRADHHFECVEVSETIRTSPMPSFVLQCQLQHTPVLLSVALPANSDYPDFRRDLKWAKDVGIGVLEVNHETSKVASISRPLSLSLTGLSRVDMRKYPAKYRQAISDAEETFLGGNPPKACSMVYDEIEAITRRIAYKTHMQGLWSKSISDPGSMKEKMPWSSVLNALKSNLDRRAAMSSGKNLGSLSDPLLSRTIGITPYRNQSGHKPKSLRDLVARDSALRTRMEDAVNLLLELIIASKCLRV